MKTNVKKITVTGLCAAILCVLSVISISIGEVPYSFAVLGVFLIGGLLSPAYAGAACLCYLLLGAVGVPVFAGFTAGVAKLAGSTGGYLIAYPFMAVVISLICKSFRKKNVWTLALGMVLALLLCYTLGTIWFMVVTGWTLGASLAACVLPFIWFDVVKAAVAILLVLLLDKTPVKQMAC